MLSNDVRLLFDTQNSTQLGKHWLGGKLFELNRCYFFMCIFYVVHLGQTLCAIPTSYRISLDSTSFVVSSAEMSRRLVTNKNSGSIATMSNDMYANNLKFATFGTR